MFFRMKRDKSVYKKRNAFLLGWLVIWVLWLPLVHIHPEADHAHGMSGHVHGGTFHTVLSSEPICAYEDHQHHHESFLPGEPFGTPDSSSHLPHGLEHSTYSFSVLTSSIDPIHEEQATNFTSDAVAVREAEARWFSCVSTMGLSSPNTAFSVVTHPSSPRAPPVLSR